MADNYDPIKTHTQFNNDEELDGNQKSNHLNGNTGNIDNERFKR